MLDGHNHFIGGLDMTHESKPFLRNEDEQKANYKFRDILERRITTYFM